MFAWLKKYNLVYWSFFVSMNTWIKHIKPVYNCLEASLKRFNGSFLLSIVAIILLVLIKMDLWILPCVFVLLCVLIMVWPSRLYKASLILHHIIANSKWHIDFIFYESIINVLTQACVILFAKLFWYVYQTIHIKILIPFSRLILCK